MTKCTFCDSEIRKPKWFTEEKIKIKEEISICTNCWFNKLKGIERYHISQRYMELLD